MFFGEGCGGGGGDGDGGGGDFSGAGDACRDWLDRNHYNTPPLKVGARPRSDTMETKNAIFHLLTRQSS